MTDWASIFLYGYLGWMVFTDAWLLIIGVGYSVGHRTSLITRPIWWFFPKRILGVAFGVVATILYRDGMVDWMWALLLACLVSIPEMLYRIWKDITQASKPAPEHQ